MIRRPGVNLVSLSTKCPHVRCEASGCLQNLPFRDAFLLSRERLWQSNLRWVHTGGVKNVSAMLLSGLSQYVGASIAVGLFTIVSGLSVGWGRIAFAAILLLLWRRPWSYPDKGKAVLFGLALGGMNLLFYLSIARIPLGTAVALEFLGPVVLAATARTKRTTVAILFAFLGVFLISWIGLDPNEPGVALGIGFALAAGVAWALYMTLGSRMAGKPNNVDGLAIGMAGAALVYSPLALGEFIEVKPDVAFWLTLAGVAVLSSVVPYVIDQLVLRDVPATIFAILNSILPAMSMVVGLVMLQQVPTWGEVAGLVCVSIAVLIATYRPKPPKLVER